MYRRTSGIRKSGNPNWWTQPNRRNGPTLPFRVVWLLCFLSQVRPPCYVCPFSGDSELLLWTFLPFGGGT